MPQRIVPTMARYISKVDSTAGPNGCWPWTGARDKDGYGLFWDGTYRPSGVGRLVRVTRWTYEQLMGPIPEGRQLCHRCDNPPCVNVMHLFLGTSKDNHEDREAKGRGRRLHGSDHGGAKLTEADVLAIRDQSDKGEPQADLARRYQVSDSLIHKIVRRKSWTHI